MTEKELDELNKNRMAILQRAGFACEVCGNPVDARTVQLAHRIPQRKHLLKKHGKRVIHHPCNLAATCCEECNASVSLGTNELKHRAVLDDIMCYRPMGGWWEDA